VKRIIGGLFVLLLMESVVSSGLMQVSIHKLAVKTGDWVEYEVERVWGDIEAYGRALRIGDKLRYKLVSSIIREMKTPDGTLIAYYESPLCDVWLNNEQVATDAEPEPSWEPFAPFTPASDAYWQDVKKLWQATKDYLKSRGFIIKEYKFDIGSDVVTAILHAVFMLPYTRIIGKIVIDRDTGVTRNVYYNYTTLIMTQGYFVKITDTNVSSAKPSAPEEAWAPLSLGLTILAAIVIGIVLVIGVFFSLKKAFIRLAKSSKPYKSREQKIASLADRWEQCR